MTCDDNLPVISIITVVLNNVKTIENTIISVINQNYKNLQYIIIDGGSTDGTVEILEKYSNNIAVWISEPDTGIYNALNKGLNLSQGLYYLVLGSDDTLYPTAISDLYENAEDGYVVCGKIKIFKNDKFIKITYGHSASALIYKKLHNRYGYYDESYKIAADTKFLMQVKNDNLLNTINVTTGDFLLGGISSNYKNTVIEHTRAMIESNSWTKLEGKLWLYIRYILFIYRK